MGMHTPPEAIAGQPFPRRNAGGLIPGTPNHRKINKASFSGIPRHREFWIASLTAGKICFFRLTTPGASNNASSTRLNGNCARTAS